jgi:hypothetical protein
MGISSVPGLSDAIRQRLTKLHKERGLVTMAHRMRQEHLVDGMRLQMFHLFSADGGGDPV